jgi:hypothetical protein
MIRTEKAVIVIFLILLLWVPAVSAAISYPYTTGYQVTSIPAISRDSSSYSFIARYQNISVPDRSGNAASSSSTTGHQDTLISDLTSNGPKIATPVTPLIFSDIIDRYKTTKNSFYIRNNQDAWYKSENYDQGLQMLTENPDACWVPLDTPITTRGFEYGPGPGQVSGVYIDGYYCDTPWIPHIYLGVIGNL